MLSSKAVYIVRCSTVKRKCFCLPLSLTPQFRRGLLPYKDIPRAPSLPIVKNIPYLMMAGGDIQRHQYIDSLHKKLGPIFIDRPGGCDIIYIADSEACFNMFQAEGKFPRHLIFPLWTEYAQSRNQKRGLLFMGGQEWRDSRNACSFMHNLVYSDEQEEEIRSITKELMNIWEKNPPTDLKYHLYSWSLECTGVNILGKSFGFLDKLKSFNKFSKKHLEEESLMKSTFHYDKTIDCYFPMWLRKILRTPTWRNYGKSSEVEMNTVSKYVEESIQECMSDKPTERAKRSVLYKLINDGSLDIEVIKRIVTDMVISAAFSITSTSLWAIYTLGRHPEVAERVRQQIISVPADESFKMSTLEKNAPLLIGAIKESLRLYPTAPQLNRITAKDTEFYGYFIPEGSIVVASMYSMARNPKYFSNPDCFLPERWSKENKLRGTVTKNHHPRAFLPFAHNIRNCVGRRIALTDMKIFLLEALKTYEWTNNEVDVEYHYVLAPSKPIELKLKSHGKYFKNLNF